LANQDPMAFWSYTRFDDEHAHGKLTALREQLEHELRSQLGTPFAIFQDTEGLIWGERWKEKLVTSIGEALFFIPVVTPTYFGSPVCRTELEPFLQREQKLLYEELILPVYWISVDRPGDQLAGALMSRNYVDFRELRFNNVDDPAVEKKIAEIASQLIKRFNEFGECQRLIADIKAIIITPKPQDRVARKIRVTGTIERIPKSMTSWLVVEAGGRYHPQALIDTKDWSATAFIGSAGFGANNNVDFPIHIIAATESASASFTQYRQEQEAHGWSGLPAPAGTKVLATATVRRNDQESALAALIGTYDEYRAKPLNPTGGTIKVKGTAYGDLAITAINYAGDTVWTGAIAVDPSTGKATATYRETKTGGQGSLELEQIGDEINVTGKDNKATKCFHMTWKKRHP